MVTCSRTCRYGTHHVGLHLDVAFPENGGADGKERRYGVPNRVDISLLSANGEPVTRINAIWSWPYYFESMMMTALPSPRVARSPTAPNSANGIATTAVITVIANHSKTH